MMSRPTQFSRVPQIFWKTQRKVHFPDIFWLIFLVVFFAGENFLLIFDTFMWNVNWQTSMKKCSVGQIFISRVTLMRFGQKAYYSVGTLEEYFIYLSFTGITPSVKFSQLCKWGSLTYLRKIILLDQMKLSSLVFYSKWKLWFWYDCWVLS